MSEVRIESFNDGDVWTDACARRMADALGDALGQRGRATFAGAGGSTPSPIYRRLSTTDLDWANIAVTLVDERHVPDDSPLSNARLMHETLLQGGASVARFIPLHSASVTVDRAAALAAMALDAGAVWPLDAVLLGMGEDGHIASMFPGSPTLKTLLDPGAVPAVLGVPPGRDGMAPPQERLSLNIAALATARRVVLALTGAKKRAVFEEQAAGDPKVTPIAALIAARVARGAAQIEVLWTEAV